MDCSFPDTGEVFARSTALWTSEALVNGGRGRREEAAMLRPSAQRCTARIRALGEARLGIHFSELPSCPYFGDYSEMEMQWV